MVQQIKRFFKGLIADKGGSAAWKFRRKLIFGAFRLGVFVILVMLPIAIFMPELQQLAIEAIQSMVGMLSIIVSAYVGGAVVDDRLNRNKDKDIEP